MDTSDPTAPKVVHAFVPRGTPGYTIKETWDTLGTRPTRCDIAISSARKRTSIGLSRPIAYHPEIQHLFSEMQIELEGMGPHIARITEDWSYGVDHGPAWPLKIVAAKYHCVESAKRVVDLAMTASGGTGMFKTSELERLYRDVRCGGFHPANTMLTHEIVGKTTLGIGLDEQPRWG
jgi:alkylation response protein AidB-like acyl-CoA dehydrogenase